MFLIAHRGASLICQENTAESLNFASKLGADAVECDIRRSHDGKFVIFHDSDLMRMCGSGKKVSELTEAEMRKELEKSNLKLYTLEQLSESYSGSAKVLLHINTEVDDALTEALRRVELDYIAGVCGLDEVRTLSGFLPRERLLGFIPSPPDAMNFLDCGCAQIRLWESWLRRTVPADIRDRRLDAKVWIMADNPKNGEGDPTGFRNMNGSADDLDRFESLGADGVLLNDIETAVNWRKRRER